MFACLESKLGQAKKYSKFSSNLNVWARASESEPRLVPPLVLTRRTRRLVYFYFPILFRYQNLYLPKKPEPEKMIMAVDGESKMAALK